MNYDTIKNEVALEKKDVGFTKLVTRYQHHYSQDNLCGLMNVIVLCDITNNSLPLWANLAVFKLYDSIEGGE